MSDYILIATVVYLWLVGGTFMTIAAADANFKGVKRARIAALVLLWPLVCAYAAAIVTKDDVMARMKKWKKKWAAR